MTNYKLGVLEKGTKEYRSTLKYYLVSSYYKEIILPSVYIYIYILYYIIGIYDFTNRWS